MHDIWNPWHGCLKCSEGCKNCYMFYEDRIHGMDGSKFYITKNRFYYPLSKDRKGSFKIKSGEMLRVCMTSDFFLEAADPYRAECFKIMRNRPDVIFFLLTKRPQRVQDCLPANFRDDFPNVFFNVSCENQKRADERIPYLLSLPFVHKGIMCAPLIGEISIEKYLQTGHIEQVLCDGESYENPRECHYEWVLKLHEECVRYNVTFCFISTGSRFVKDGRVYCIEGNALKSEQALRANLNFQGKKIKFLLTDSLGLPIPDEHLYKPHFKKRCYKCSSRMICNGCSDCGRC